MSTPRELVNEAYGFLYGSDAEDAVELIEKAFDALEADLAATRDALHLIAHSQGGKFELLTTMREIARAALAEQYTPTTPKEGT